MLFLCGPSHRYFYFNHVLAIPVIVYALYSQAMRQQLPEKSNKLKNLSSYRILSKIKRSEHLIRILFSVEIQEVVYCSVSKVVAVHCVPIGKADCLASLAQKIN